MQFPSNPADGQIFEVQDNLHFVFDAQINVWTRIEGYQFPTVATTVSAGLMSSTDFVKLYNLVLPPPQASLTLDDCDTTFTTGSLAIDSADAYIEIDTTAGFTTGRVLHQNSYSFDFTVDVTQLFQYLEANGQFRVISPQGPKGNDGSAGEDGDDELLHGPDGLDGESGANAEFDGVLSAEVIPLQRSVNDRRVVVDITTEAVSANENYLVLQRALLGNPLASPASLTITPGLASNWVVCLSPDTSAESVQFDRVNCQISGSKVYYLNIKPIMDAIERQYKLEAARLKAGMERVITHWLNTMSSLFDEQKAALCCALEHCRSQRRNVDTRRYIEQSRIQAAQSNHSVVIDGSPGTGSVSTVATIPTTQACEPDGFGGLRANSLPTSADPQSGSICYPVITLIDGVPHKYDECPPGHTPRTVYRGFKETGEIDGFSNSAVQFVAQEFAAKRQEFSAMRADRMAPVEIQIQGGSPDLVFVPGLNADPNASSKHFASYRKQGNLHIFNALLAPATYTVCLTNTSEEDLTVYISSQSAAFIGGAGPSWSGRQKVAGDYLADTIYTLPKASGKQWLQIKVYSTGGIAPQYSAACGALGPIITGLDKRICREPILENAVLDDWFVSSYGPNVKLPDSFLVTVDKQDIVLCRRGLGDYVGAYYGASDTIKVVLEQSSPGRYAYPDSPVHSLKNKLSDSEPGSGSFNITVLMWSGSDCSGTPSRSYTSTLALNQTLSFTTTGKGTSGSIRLSGRPFKNDRSELKESSEYFLTMYGSSKDPYKRSEIDLPAGSYQVEIIKLSLRVGGQYTGHIQVQHALHGKLVSKNFPFLGASTDLAQAAQVYENQSINLEHSGGKLTIQLIHRATTADGSLVVKITRMGSSVGKQVYGTCKVASRAIRTAQDRWLAGADGYVINVHSQDYIVTRFEDKTSDCSVMFGDPWVAWPTFDGQTFVEIPSTEIMLKLDQSLLEVILKLIRSKKYTKSVGSQIPTTILFPIVV